MKTTEPFDNRESETLRRSHRVPRQQGDERPAHHTPKGSKPFFFFRLFHVFLGIAFIFIWCFLYARQLPSDDGSLFSLVIIGPISLGPFLINVLGAWFAKKSFSQVVLFLFSILYILWASFVLYFICYPLKHDYDIFGLLWIGIIAGPILFCIWLIVFFVELMTYLGSKNGKKQPDRDSECDMASSEP